MINLQHRHLSYPQQRQFPSKPPPVRQAQASQTGVTGHPWPHRLRNPQQCLLQVLGSPPVHRVQYTLLKQHSMLQALPQDSTLQPQHPLLQPQPQHSTLWAEPQQLTLQAQPRLFRPPQALPRLW